MDKKQFIQSGCVPLLKDLQADTMGRWGRMNAQQMVEHVTDFFRLSSGNASVPVITPEEHLPKYREFIFSDKEFRENTKAPTSIVPEIPLPPRHSSMQQSFAALQNEINAFFHYFEPDDKKTLPHPVFGPLNFEEWILLHYKHVTHHWRQFGLISKPAEAPSPK